LVNMTSQGNYKHLENNCILCGKCLEVCPLFQATNKEQLSPRGKAFLLQELAHQGEELKEKDVRKLAAICLGCHRCVEVCPQKVNLPVVLNEIKAEVPGWKSWLWGKLIEEAPRIFPLLSQAGKIIPEINPAARGNKLSFFSRQEEIKPWLMLEAFDTCAQEQKVVIFPGCTARFAKRNWLESAAALLRGTGYKLLQTPDWCCCGFTLGSAGLRTEQLQMQTENLRLWRALGRPQVAVFCATCLLGLKEMTASDLGWEEGEKEVWQDAIQELGGMLGKPDFTTIEENVPQRVTLHKPCHAENKILDWMQRLLSFSQVEYKNSTACCGLGGCMQIENQRLCSQVAGSFWKVEEDFRPQQVITACSGCALQLAATHPANVQVGHWLELIGNVQ
jgi:glycolate oxidase iron-sulfur subunit